MLLQRQTGERLNWKELAQEYLDTFGGTYFENSDLDEFKIVKPDPKDTMGIKRNQMPQVATKDYPRVCRIPKGQRCYIYKRYS